MQEEISSAFEKNRTSRWFQQIFCYISPPIQIGKRIPILTCFDIVFRFFLGGDLSKKPAHYEFLGIFFFFFEKSNQQLILKVHGSILVVRSSRWNVPGQVRVFFGLGGAESDGDIWWTFLQYHGNPRFLRFLGVITYNPYFGSVKPSTFIFHGFGVQGYEYIYI